jgi:hypothetical protein
MPSITKKYSYKTDPLTGGTVRDKVISSKVEAERKWQSKKITKA